MINGTSKFERRHILYCDILGFSNFSTGEFFEPSICFRLFKDLDNLIHQVYEPVEKSAVHPHYIVNPEAIYCSDSIAISTPATNIDAIWLCQLAAQIQNLVCMHGFLLRGAIVTGQLYHSGNTIFGPAIVDAVSKDISGAPPIILIDDSTLEIFCEANTSSDSEIISIRKQQLISEDNSEMRYIDPFWKTKSHTTQETINNQTKIEIQCWRNLITTGLKSKNLKISSKYKWMAEKFNKALCNKKSNINSITY